LNIFQKIFFQVISYNLNKLNLNFDVNLDNNYKIYRHFLKAHFLIQLFVKISLVLLFLIFSIYFFFIKKNKDNFIIFFDNYKNIFKFLKQEIVFELIFALTIMHYNDSENLEKIKERDTKLKDYYRYIIIGSGPSASITLNHLQNYTSDILVVEKGNDYQEAKLKHPADEFYKKWQNGGLSAAVGNSLIKYAAASCLGGGSEINSGLYHEPDERFIDNMKETYKVNDFDYSNIKKFCLEIKKILNVEVANDLDLISKNIIKISNKKQIKFEIVPRLAKNFMKDNFIRSTVKKEILNKINKNIKISHDSEVIKIFKKKNFWNVIVLKGKTKKIIKSEKLFLCAGSLNTTSLLIKSNLINKKINSHFHFHPMVKFAVKFKNKVNILDGDISPIQINEHYPDFILGNASNSFSQLMINAQGNAEMQNEIKKNFKNFAIFHLTFSLGSGQIFHSPFSNDPIVYYHINDDELDKMKSGIKKVLKYFEHKNVDKIFLLFNDKIKYESANIQKVMDQIKKPSQLNLGAVHILGGIPFGENTENTLCNSYGELRGHSNLYVNDSSLICAHLLKNPQGTVMAIAKRNIENIMNNS